MIKKLLHLLTVLLSVAALIGPVGLISSYFSDSNNNNYYHQRQLLSQLAYGEPQSSPVSYALTKTNSGLTARDLLTNTSGLDTNYWTIGGDAVSLNAPHSYSEDSSGLHIGIQAASSGQWAGFYAMAPKTSAHLYHAMLTIPFKLVSDHWWDTGIYIQTSSPTVNYVTCAAVVDAAQVTWEVISTKGDTNSAKEFNTLWKDIRSNQPYTRDCTIITDGYNSLQVYLDNQLVYSNNTLDLQMPLPFNAYLEVQSSTASQEYTGTYTDFYATTSQYVTVTDSPAGSKVDIIDSSTNNVLASSTAGSDGTINLDVGKYHMPLSAYIKAYDSSGNLVAKSSNALSIWAGDVYSMSPSSSSSSNSSAASNSYDNNKHQPTNNNNNNDNPSKSSKIVHSVITSVLKLEDDHKGIGQLISLYSQSKDKQQEQSDSGNHNGGDSNSGDDDRNNDNHSVGKNNNNNKEGNDLIKQSQRKTNHHYLQSDFSIKSNDIV